MGLPSKDPYGHENPHRGGCKLCNRVKRIVKVPHDSPAGYFLFRICDWCDCVR